VLCPGSAAPTDFHARVISYLSVANVSAQANGHYEDSLKQARKVLKELNKWSKYDVRNKTELLANIHSCLGNGYLETGDYNKALTHHTTDYDLANKK